MRKRGGDDNDVDVVDEDDVLSTSHSLETMVMDFISSTVVRTCKQPPFLSICHSENGIAEPLAALCAINRGLRVMPLSYSSPITFSLAVVALPCPPFPSPSLFARLPPSWCNHHDCSTAR